MTTDVETQRGRRIPWRMILWSIPVLLQLTMLVAMQFTPEVNWTLGDFIFASLMFGVVGLGLELAVRTRNSSYRWAAGLALAAGFLLVWINGAVGIIGSEQEDANALFLLVIAIAFLGSVLAEFRAAGMAWAMTVAALGQASVPFVALLAGQTPAASVLAPEVIISTIVFVGIWLLSALLFRRAAAQGKTGR